MLALLGGAAPAGRLELSVANLRSDAGVIRICLTRDPEHFPDCVGDPDARHLTAPASDADHLAFDDVPSGTWAVSLFHDENGNGKLDTFAGIPREGVGFSRNPSLLFGPPRFAAADFPVTSGPVGEAVKMRYFL